MIGTLHGRVSDRLDTIRIMYIAYDKCYTLTKLITLHCKVADRVALYPVQSSGDFFFRSGRPTADGTAAPEETDQERSRSQTAATAFAGWLSRDVLEFVWRLAGLGDQDVGPEYPGFVKPFLPPRFHGQCALRVNGLGRSQFSG